MAMYTNIGGTSKELEYLRFNKDGAIQGITDAYANINGTNKEIFSAIKQHWWKRYEVTEWELKKIPKSSNMIVGAVKYNDEFGTNELRIETTRSTNNWSGKYLWYDPSISISNHFNTSTGFFDKDFIDSGTEIDSGTLPLDRYNKEMYI